MENENRIKLKRFEHFLTTLKLSKVLYKIRDVECDLRSNLNPIVMLNNLYFYQNEWIGLQDFFNIYVENNEKELKKLCGEEDWNTFLLGLNARVYRTIIGYLTEYHIYLLAKCYFFNIYKSSKLDRHGVDFQILYDHRQYNIHIFVDTPRSRQYRQVKLKTKHSDMEYGIHVNMPYKLKGNAVNSLSYFANGFGIVKEEYMRYFKNKIDKENYNGRHIDLP